MRQILQDCWQHLEENAPERAMQLLVELDREWRDSPDRLRLQAVLEAETTVECWLGRLPLAERQAKRCVARAVEVTGERSSESVRALLSLARVYWRQNRDTDAMRIIDQVMTMDARELELEQWRLAHRTLGLMRLGLNRDALASLGPLEDLAKSRYTRWHPNRLNLNLLRCRLSRLSEQAEVTGQLLNQIETALETHSELHPLYYGERALYSMKLQRWEDAVRWAGQACHVGEQRVNFCRLAAARHFEVLATAHMELEQLELALAALMRADQCLRWRDSLPCEGFFAPVMWPEDSELDWPLLWPSWSHPEEVQLWLDLAGRRSRLLRRMGQEEAARIIATAAKAVRATRGEARLGGRNPALEDTVVIRARIEGPGRVPAQVGWESARGELELVGDGARGRLLALVGGERTVLSEDSDLFLQPLGPAGVELFLYARDARSSQKSAVPYTVWVSFTTGPALRIPIEV